MVDTVNLLKAFRFCHCWQVHSPNAMLSRFAAALLLFEWLLPIHAQNTTAFVAQPIRTSDGQCISAVSSVLDGEPVQVRQCDGSSSQQWDGVTNSSHIRDPGFVLLVASGTAQCIDAKAFNNSPGTYSCGGIPGGQGNASINQAFTYTALGRTSSPFVFIPISAFVNNGQGPGQGCLTVVQNALNVTPCDQSSPSPQQQFFVGALPSSTTQPNSTTPSSKNSKSTSPNVIAIAVPVAVVVALLILIPFIWNCRRPKSNVERNKRYIEKEMLSPTPFSTAGASTDATSIPAMISSKLSLGSGIATQAPMPPVPAFSATRSPSTPRSQSPGTQGQPPLPSPEQTPSPSKAPPVNVDVEISDAIPVSNVAAQNAPFAINTANAQSFPRGAVPVLLSANIDFNELMSHLNERDQPNERLPSYQSPQEGGVHPFDVR